MKNTWILKPFWLKPIVLSNIHIFVGYQIDITMECRVDMAAGRHGSSIRAIGNRVEWYTCVEWYIASKNGPGADFKAARDCDRRNKWSSCLCSCQRLGWGCRGAAGGLWSKLNGNANEDRWEAVFMRRHEERRKNIKKKRSNLTASCTDSSRVVYCIFKQRWPFYIPWQAFCVVLLPKTARHTWQLKTSGELNTKRIQNLLHRCKIFDWSCVWSLPNASQLCWIFEILKLAS